MNFKKILAAIASTAVAVSAMTFSAFASEPVHKPTSYEAPAILISGDDLPASVYSKVEATFKLTVNEMNYGWANGDAGFCAGGSVFAEAKFGGTECDKPANRSWFPEGSVVIANDQKSATVVCKADLTGQTGAGIFIYSGQPTDEGDNGYFDLESVTIKSDLGLEASYSNGKLTVISEGSDPASAAEEAADEDEGDADEATDEAVEEAADDADADDAEVDNGLVKKFAPITLNANGDKLVQYDISSLEGKKLEQFTIIGKIPPAEDGWVGGGGQVGYNCADGWIQIDYNVGEGMAVADDEGNMVAVVDFTTLGKDTTFDTSNPNNLLQLGWWWGSGDGSLEITDMGVNGVSLITGKAITTSLEADDAPVIVDAAPAAGNVDAATDSSKGSPDTGAADVAAVAGLAIVAAGAVIVSKKRK